jgi:predicted AAA+ superfamily ATPase
MFKRTILTELTHWLKKKNRKPLILRGARQVGKTTAISIFANNFKQYIYLNLERSEDLRLFEQDYNIQELVEAIFFLKGKQRQQTNTLLFIDEIQNSPKAVAMLRYFHEEMKDLYVIAAGSLLESILNRHISFPVGRVEYLRMHPLSFEEFLQAIGEMQAVEMLERIPLPVFAHDKLLKLFHRYTLIGGMPEIVQLYAESQDLIQLKPVYDSLITAYMDDVEKYSSRESQTPIIQLLEKALLLQRIYPTTATQLPLTANLKKSPKLQLLDTGLVNYFSGLQTEIFGTKDLNSIYGGRIIEHLVGQELLASQHSTLFKPHFWVKENKQSNAEVDFVLQHGNKIIPIEVKSGATGRLRSLHEFINQADHNYAVRLYAGELKVETATTITGKQYSLLNLPYFLAGKMTMYLDWFVTQ